MTFAPRSAMTFGAAIRLGGMSTSTTVSNLGVAMFTVADQDAALAFYTDKLGYEVRSDMRFGPDGSYRWLEVAPPGSTARLALNAPMNSTPGGAAIGVETADLAAEHERLSGLDGVEINSDMMSGGEGAPPMFGVSDPDGNWIWVVEVPAS
jgi:catechol 2,3-dioxygenase-like lactoylglutathione lyase family enzyme